MEKKVIRHISSYKKMNWLIVILIIGIVIESNAQNQYLEKSVSTIKEEPFKSRTGTARFKSIFNKDIAGVTGVEHFAQIMVDPQGKSKFMDHENLEHVYYVLEGTGTFQFDKTEIPISRDDFFYVPRSMKHAFSNVREDTLKLLMMGFRVPKGVMEGSTKVQIASAEKVDFQPMPGHGATSRYKLLMGRTDSKRDKIAATSQVTSLFIIDFFPLGTNIPHKHQTEEEIYFILDGKGKMVAGEDGSGHDLYHPAKKGDAFFVGRDTSVGFYSENGEGEEHAKILAVRFKIPDKP